MAPGVQSLRPSRKSRRDFRIIDLKIATKQSGPKYLRGKNLDSSSFLTMIKNMKYIAIGGMDR